MKIDFNTYPQAIQRLRDLCQTFHLRLDISDPNRALLIGEGYAVSVIVDREGVRYWYIDTANLSNIVEYALDFFIVRKRLQAAAKTLPTSTKNVDRVKVELDEACEQLNSYGSDILSGGRDWLKDYDFGVIKPVGDYRRNLVKIIGN